MICDSDILTRASLPALHPRFMLQHLREVPATANKLLFDQYCTNVDLEVTSH